MSMLSLQIAKLRETADMLDGLKGIDNLVRILREAADTIEALRERLQGEDERVECENVAPSYLDFLCSSCGFVHYHSDENDSGDGNEWNFCPNCGKAVKR